MSPADHLDVRRLEAALRRATEELLAARTPHGYWEGELSSSALATATAVTALAVAQRAAQSSDFKSPIAAGLGWLAGHANPDGGWGDTTKSLSNISTTTLGWAAFGAAGADGKFSATIQNAEGWLARHIRSNDYPHLTPALSPPSGSGEGETTRRSGVPDSAFRLPPSALARAIIARYGQDRTFSVPILTLCALAGRLGVGREAWRHVIPLPFELAACPHQLFAALRLPVVSYALPALIAIGQARHVHRPTRNPITRLLRNFTRQRTLKLLAEIQPENGGFLEATPLTSFVTMSLAGSGQVNHAVVRRGVEFLRASQRADGSWPIDTNLATWVTTLAIDALPHSALRTPHSAINWLLAQQYRTEHPYTHAAPGGWAWTDLPGGVPDADDTAGALLALARMRNAECGMRNEEVRAAAIAGIKWLLSLQNRDGGIPTFCRGWGALPFDRSSADITAHAMRAWLAWFDDVDPGMQKRLMAAMNRAVSFLVGAQRHDGSWLPLWFGNQSMPDDENPTYGTARVLEALVPIIKFAAGRSLSVREQRNFRQAHEAESRGALWLICSQRMDGGWGGGRNGPVSVEETALAVQGLAGLAARSHPAVANRERVMLAANNGARWLMARVESGEWMQPSPIGFYFAKLWYFERLYPLIFTVGALRQVAAFANAKAP